MTRYVILCQAKPQAAEGAMWEQWDEFPAHSAEAAIRQAAREDGTYVAIPLSQFKPVTVTVKQERKVTLAPTTEPKPE